MRVRALAIVAAAVATAATLIAGGGVAHADPLTAPKPVPKVELTEYLGTWKQLAAVPAPFSLNCARDTRATYSLAPDGDVLVRNRCTSWAGTPDGIRGTAKVVDDKSNAQLLVSFPGVPESAGPNYVIVGLARDYSWAVVTDPSRLSGFVLSRTSTLPQQDWASVRAAISAAGQSDCMYLTSPTAGGIEAITPLCATSLGSS